MSEQPNIRKLLEEGGKALQLDISKEACGALERYYGELVRWSSKVNLIGKKQTGLQIIENHFLDSLILLPYLQNDECTLVDVGSGAGFPGLVCKTALPDLNLVLVEPRLKRVSFLRHIIRSLKLEKVVVSAERLEDVAPDHLRCTHIVSRAVTDIGAFLAMVDCIVGESAEIICMKGPKWQDELAQASALLDDGAFALSQVDEFTLPFSGASRAILVFRKNSAR